MENTKVIEETVNKLIANLKEESDWNDRMLEKMELPEWEAFLVQRSEAIRKFYAENEEYCKILADFSSNISNDETANAMFEAVRAMWINGRLDEGFICRIAGPVIDYLIERDEINKAIIAIAIRNASANDYYSRMDAFLKRQLLIDSYSWVVSNGNRYSKLDDYRARDNLWYSYEHLMLMYIITEKEEDISLALDCLDKLRETWKKPEVQAEDRNVERIRQIISGAYRALPLEVTLRTPLCEDVKERIVEIIDKHIADHCDDSEWYEQMTIKLLIIRRDVFTGTANSNSTVDRYLDLINEIPATDWEKDSESSRDTFIIFVYIYIGIMTGLEDCGYSEEEKKQRVRKALDAFAQVIKGMPYLFMTDYINDSYKNIFERTTPFLTDIRWFEKMFHEMFALRQPSTYIHSQMVEKISVLIARHILDVEPELFLSLPEYDTVNEIIGHQDELLEQIARSARFHDIGKINIASLIMRQSRKIMDDEFSCIKLHPGYGVEYVKNLADAEMYKAVILGHHRTYDGKGGYPAAFDNTASPYRFVIDLISISDSTDAATDIIGRNYAAGKKFTDVLEELKSGAGTRYNPDIVRIISDSPELIDKLGKLTSTERFGQCYAAYRECLNY